MRKLMFWQSLKVADFGSCRGIQSKKPFTEYISTRWFINLCAWLDQHLFRYRAPECLLTKGYYDSKMDMWGIGFSIHSVMIFFFIYLFIYFLMYVMIHLSFSICYVVRTFIYLFLNLVWIFRVCILRSCQSFSIVSWYKRTRSNRKGRPL